MDWTEGGEVMSARETGLMRLDGGEIYPSDLVPENLQNIYWRQKDRQLISIQKMDDQHLRNTALMLIGMGGLSGLSLLRSASRPVAHRLTHGMGAPSDARHRDRAEGMNFQLPKGTTLKEQAQEVHLQHVAANGGDGHSPRDEWRRCEHVLCAAFRDSISGRSVKR